MQTLGPVAAYWKVVEGCLIELFELPRARARVEIADLRARLLLVGANTRSPNDLIYHTEPLHIAADLAHVPLNEQEAHFARYREIRDRYLKPLDTPRIARRKSRRVPSSPPPHPHKQVAAALILEFAAAR